MKKSSVILLLLYFIFFNLPGQAVYTLVPEAPQGMEIAGREYISLSSGDLSLELGFDGFFGDYLVFDLVIVNQGQQELDIDPEDFYYLCLADADADTSALPPFSATDPGLILHQYECMMSERGSGGGLNTFFGALETSLDILSSASAFAATEDPGYIIDAVFSTVGAVDYYSSLGRNNIVRSNQLREEKAVVSREMMRPGEILPGKVLSGFVFFPVFNESGHVMFCFPLADQLFQFVYHQRVVLQE